MRRGGVNRYGSKQLTKRAAESAVVSLLYGCATERLSAMTPASLAASYRISVEKAEILLANARKARL